MKQITERKCLEPGFAYGFACGCLSLSLSWDVILKSLTQVVCLPLDVGSVLNVFFGPFFSKVLKSHKNQIFGRNRYGEGAGFRVRKKSSGEGSLLRPVGRLSGGAPLNWRPFSIPSLKAPSADLLGKSARR